MSESLQDVLLSRKSCVSAIILKLSETSNKKLLLILLMSPLFYSIFSEAESNKDVGGQFVSHW